MKKLFKYLLILFGLVLGAGVIMCGILVIFPSVSIFNIKYQTRSKAFYNNINVEEFNFKYANEKGDLVQNNFSYSIPKFNTITINTDYYDVEVKASDVENNQNEIRVRMNKEYTGFIKANSKTVTRSSIKLLYDVENYVVYEVPKSDGTIEERTIKVYKIETTFVKNESNDYIQVGDAKVLESNIRQGEEGIFKEENGLKKIKIYEENGENYNFYNINNSYLLETYNLVIDLENVEKLLLLKDNTNAIIELPAMFFTGNDTNLVINSKSGNVKVGGDEEVIQVVEQQENLIYKLYNKTSEKLDVLEEKAAPIVEEAKSKAKYWCLDKVKKGLDFLSINNDINLESISTDITTDRNISDNANIWDEQSIIYSEAVRKLVDSKINLNAIDFNSKKFVNYIVSDTRYTFVPYETLLFDKTKEYNYSLKFNDIIVNTTTGNVYINKTIKYEDSEEYKLNIKTTTGSIFNCAIMNISSSYETDNGNITIKPYHENHQIINGNINVVSNTSVINIPSINGNVVCNSKSGQINIDQITGSFSATEKTSHTEININYVDGEFLVPEAEYSNITLKETNSKLSIYTKKGKINIGSLTTITSAEPYKATLRTDSGEIKVDYIDNTNLDVNSISGKISLSYSKTKDGVTKYNTNNSCQLNVESQKSEINLNDVNVYLDVLVTQKTSKKINVSFKELVATTESPSAIKVKEQNVIVKLNPTQPVTIVADKANLDKLKLDEKNKTNVEYKIKKTDAEGNEVEVSYGKINLFNQKFDESKPTYSSNILILYTSSGDSENFVVETY